MNKINRIKEMREVIAELETRRAKEVELNKRIFNNIATYYGERQKKGVGEPLTSLLDKAKLRVEDLEEFYKAEEREAERTLSEVTPRLQLQKEEVELFKERVRSVALINPCSAFHSSPIWVCQQTATSIICDPPLLTGKATASGQCGSPMQLNNRCDPMVKAEGQGAKGYSSAEISCIWYFDIPARNNPQTVTIDVWVDIHGFYILRPSAGMAASAFTLDLEAEGFQYGWSWASAKKTLLYRSGTASGRFDDDQVHQGFVMPVGADPFQVRVTVKLKATAFGGGSLAVGDFQTGAGNYVNVCWVNTDAPLP